jgi:hypothetical protein
MNIQTNRFATGKSGAMWITRPHTGFVAGTILLTLDGEVPVEQLVPGMQMITRNSGFAELENVDIQEVTTRPVCIDSGVTGDNYPDRDLVLGPDQPVLVRDWRARAMFGAEQALVPVNALVDGEFIDFAPLQTLTLFNPVFDCRHILYVEGLELASGQCTVDPQISSLANTFGNSSGMSSAIIPGP